MLAMSGKLNEVQQRIKSLCAEGKTIELFKDTGKTGDGTRTDLVSLSAFPVKKAPFDRRTLNQVSFADRVTVICYVSKLEVIEKVQKISQLKRRNMAEIDGEVMKVTQIENYSSFSDDHLYIVIGCVRN